MEFKFAIYIYHAFWCPFLFPALVDKQLQIGKPTYGETWIHDLPSNETMIYTILKILLYDFI